MPAINMNFHACSNMHTAGTGNQQVYAHLQLTGIGMPAITRNMHAYNKQENACLQLTGICMTEVNRNMYACSKNEYACLN